jgi:prolyl-tRNA editing enzyme YbaK/EbsC (Cys-tRNA(Pro) deacylase)
VQEVRALAGFATGGVPPVVHAAFPDEDILLCPRVFAAGGTPRALFALTQARVADLKEA